MAWLWELDADTDGCVVVAGVKLNEKEALALDGIPISCPVF